VTDVTGTGNPEAAPAAPPALVARQAPAAHQAAVADLRRAYAAIPPGSPIRLAKRTSNLFRFSGASRSEGLDVSAFDHVISVDAAARTALVGGMTTYEDLADATLRHNLMPLVVPQLKTITLGGAVTGLGIESSSLRSGMPHESVTEMEILTGDGRVVTAAEGNEHHALYRGFPNSYGTLGYALSLTIELEPVTPFVHLRHFRYDNPDACMDAIAQIAQDGSLSGHRADFVDGTVFGLDEMYLTVGAFSEVGPWLSDYTRERIYYRSIRGPKEDFLTIYDYLWRWDTDWFWCSRAFGAQNPRIRRFWPRRYRRSSVYWKLIAYDQRFNIADRIEKRNGRPPRERVVQDIEVPIERTAEFLGWFLANVPIEPIWLCPLLLRDDSDESGAWPLYPIRPHHTYVNIGFWSSVPVGPTDGYTNRMIEREVSELDGHKSLYSDAFYSHDEFDELYGGEAYKTVKKTYDPESRLLDLYAKAVQRR
jgi:FAD/FMN-containing dehydrogenase